ncbi:hypothetical protein [Dokdonella soli]|uniref:hypothetical protein n=1 Tax=Dokdonella soli TaxID=529810 RepID=UPI0036D3EA81
MRQVDAVKLWRHCAVDHMDAFGRNRKMLDCIALGRLGYRKEHIAVLDHLQLAVIPRTRARCSQIVPRKDQRNEIVENRRRHGARNIIDIRASHDRLCKTLEHAAQQDRIGIETRIFTRNQLRGDTPARICRTITARRQRHRIVIAPERGGRGQIAQARARLLGFSRKCAIERDRCVRAALPEPQYRARKTVDVTADAARPGGRLAGLEVK